MTHDRANGPVARTAAEAAALPGGSPELLRQLGASLLLTAYQAGKFVMVRDEGDRLNTHYRTF